MPGPSTRRLAALTAVFAGLSFLNLRMKLVMTPAFLDGTLERNHHLLTGFDYSNNEQSRLLQYLVPEGFVRAFHLSVQSAYILQRWLFVTVAFLLFYLYLRRWFSDSLAVAAVFLLAAILPFTYMNDLQESAPFLMVSFVAGLWAMRDGPLWLAALVLAVGALNNETTLVLPFVYFVYRAGPSIRRLWSAAWRTAVVAAPPFAVTFAVRWVTRDRPRLTEFWQWDTNLAFLRQQWGLSPFGWYKATFYFPIFMFGALWLFAYLHWRDKPRFMRASLVTVPLLVASSLITGLIQEVRLFVPLGFVIIPAALHWLFPAPVAAPDVDVRDEEAVLDPVGAAR
jgi:hypothetical protein